ncbi:phosphate starvation-inducible protein PhoH [Burkholderia mallei]|uniref:Phosphate starvation-inducible protein PhoH n=1 Tax=Burkholderia mallei TaxID=13373 RepID=A0AAX1X0G2_BURML|nr:hypothetical protein [Burkholderia mallei]MBF4066341.1 phosphate starvation-inducible protein PhoH [Burkholderia pseudomallei]AIO51524.1 phosphate/sulfate permease domain protein [Burkholderia mallei]AIO59000.1 phosphate/sulfate permease domain protein [Burkholderia mallei]AIO63203.1 phosphate/sulfate permease domain protein [Burkholderia mallei]AIP76985.1 hypothetical protein DM51_2167 [Burkholderia mallei]
MHQTPACSEPSEPTLVDIALVGVDNLSALSRLLSAKDGAALFSGLDLDEQKAIFDLYGVTLTAVRSTLHELRAESRPEVLHG